MIILIDDGVKIYGLFLYFKYGLTFKTLLNYHLMFHFIFDRLIEFSIIIRRQMPDLPNGTNALKTRRRQGYVFLRAASGGCAGSWRCAYPPTNRFSEMIADGYENLTHPQVCTMPEAITLNYI